LNLHKNSTLQLNLLFSTAWPLTVTFTASNFPPQNIFHTACFKLFGGVYGYLRTLATHDYSATCQRREKKQITVPALFLLSMVFKNTFAGALLFFCSFYVIITYIGRF